MHHLNHNLKSLTETASKHEKTGIGLMSGTSLDGLDIALCKFKGNGLGTTFELLEFTTVPYAEDFKNEVRQVFSRKMVDLEKLCLLNAYIGNFHAELILDSLKLWNVKPEQVD